MFAVIMVSGSCSGIVCKLWQDRGTSDPGKMHSVLPLRQLPEPQSLK